MRPTLQQIAAMPLSEGVAAMRRFYDRDWHVPATEHPEEWTVDCSYSVTVDESERVTVEACSRREAEKLATEIVREIAGGCDLDIDFVRARPARAASEPAGFPLLDTVH